MLGPFGEAFYFGLQLWAAVLGLALSLILPVCAIIICYDTYVYFTNNTNQLEFVKMMPTPPDSKKEDAVSKFYREHPNEDIAMVEPINQASQ